VRLKLITDQGDIARRNRGYSTQGRPITQQTGLVGDLAQHRPLDRERLRQNQIDLGRQLICGDTETPTTPRQAVDRPARVPQQAEAAIVDAPGQDVSPPTGADGAAAQVDRTAAAANDGGQGLITPAVLPDQDMTAVHETHVQGRARSQIDLQASHRDRASPPDRLKRPARLAQDGGVFGAGPARLNDQIPATGPCHRQ
jgi:hypothetical protein